jgi:hypothetical protein
MDRIGSDFHRHRMVAESLVFRTNTALSARGRLPLIYNKRT